MLLALVIGILSGLRSLAPLAVVAWAAHAGWLTLPPALAWLGGTVATIILCVLAVGELIADKLPTTPSRTALPPLIARAVTGGLAGAAVAGGPIGIVVGIVGAVLGTFGGYRARMGLTQVLGGSALVAALLEDLVTIAGAFWVVTRLQ